jgi:hypothetical protein
MASIKPTEKMFLTAPKSLCGKDMRLFHGIKKGHAELFAYRIVLNRIVHPDLPRFKRALNGLEVAVRRLPKDR